MDRRHFLEAGVATAGALVIPFVRAQPAPNRAAVVIGVDKPGALTPLRAAAKGARTVETWLKAEGFEVKRFTDDDGPVRASDLFDAIRSYVDRGTLEQLVIYFAGHGFISGSLSEFWLLSGAPDNPNEAVSLIESCVKAEQSGIPNVVFISDACRSRADSLSAERVHGSVVFPSRSGRTNVTTDVDQFLATKVGQASYEGALPITESVRQFQGVYTSCFLEAFEKPYQTMVHSLSNGRLVIPNRRLRSYLAQEVPRKARLLNITLDQQPDSKVYSDEPTFIAHVKGSSRSPDSDAVPTLSDAARVAVWSQIGKTPAPIRPLGAAMDNFEAAQQPIVQARGLPIQLSARSGFTVSGQRVRSVLAGSGIKADFSNSNSQGIPSAMVEVNVQGRPASVALRFDDGTGTIVAALDGYVGSIVVERGLVTNVSYVPSRLNPMRSYYEAESKHLDQLHATVATAARFGVFRIESSKSGRNRDAEQFADQIRVLKGIDPTLGIYAAYAYAEAGLLGQVESVQQHMRDSLNGATIFDVAMLSGRLQGRGIDSPDWPVPCCPMLSQGWGLLRIKEVRLTDRVNAARDHLQGSLWTTLSRQGMDLVEEDLRSGRAR